MDIDDLSLVFINRIGKTLDGYTEYMLYYSDTPDDVWAEDFPEQVPSACYIENLIPAAGTYNAVRRATSKADLKLIQDNSCFSMQDCMDGVIALAWIMDTDGNYYPLHYASSVAVSDAFFKKYAFELEAFNEVDRDKANYLKSDQEYPEEESTDNDEDNIFLQDLDEDEEDENNFNPF